MRIGRWRGSILLFLYPLKPTSLQHSGINTYSLNSLPLSQYWHATGRNCSISTQLHLCCDVRSRFVDRYQIIRVPKDLKHVRSSPFILHPTRVYQRTKHSEHVRSSLFVRSTQDLLAGSRATASIDTQCLDVWNQNPKHVRSSQFMSSPGAEVVLIISALMVWEEGGLESVLDYDATVRRNILLARTAWE